MPDKLTDRETVKALSNMTYGGHYCAKCKYDNGKGEDRCGLKGCKIARYALDLINRLQAEKEELVGNIDKLKAELFDKTEQLKTAKTEAYEEFAEWLKEVFSDFDELLERITPENIYKAIDDFLKEKECESGGR